VTSQFTHSAKGLIVDDDPDIRTFAVLALAQEGYKIVSAADAGEALQLARLSPDGFDFLVTDYQLGEATGVDVAAALHLIFPSIRTVMISGTDLQRFSEHSQIDACLAKPFTATTLCAAVRNVLTDPAAGAASLPPAERNHEHAVSSVQSRHRAAG